MNKNLKVYKNCFFTIQDIHDCLAFFKIKKASIAYNELDGIVVVTIFNIKWYSFLEKNRIKKLKKLIDNSKPVGTFIYIITKKENK